MREAVIAEVSTQLSEVVGVIERHLEPTLLAVHLYGSAVDGGLKPHSDIDLGSSSFQVDFRRCCMGAASR